MVEKSRSKADQVAALRIARATRRSNEFEDAARGRDPAPKSSDGGVAKQRKQPPMVSRLVPPGSSEAKSGSVSEDKMQEARKQAPRLEKGSTPLLSTTSKRGRPLAKDAHKALARTKPWEAEGMSKATWYRRKKGMKP